MLFKKVWSDARTCTKQQNNAVLYRFRDQNKLFDFGETKISSKKFYNIDPMERKGAVDIRR